MPILIALLIALAGFNAAADVRFITETADFQHLFCFEADF